MFARLLAILVVLSPLALVGGSAQAAQNAVADALSLAEKIDHHLAQRR